MRQAGTLTTKQDAERFSSYLLTLGIHTKVEPSADAWAIWVRDENEIPRSKQELAEFQAQPNDARYRAAESAAQQVRREEAAKRRQAQRNYVDLRNEWANPWRRRPVTLALIGISVVVWFGALGVPKDMLYFSWPDITSGQAWRLITPIFLHFSLMHIVFNLWWLYDLGTIIENRLRSFRFALLVLVIAVASNVGQAFAVGPEFGGMSGVVYGLFGYAWVRGRLDPASGLYLRPDVAFWMMAWFFLCAAGAVGNVANWAHGVGLAAGAVLGFLPRIGDFLRGNA